MEVHTFPKVISSKVNVIAQLGLELAYNDVTIAAPQTLRHLSLQREKDRIQNQKQPRKSVYLIYIH